jgi:hypothetical protein
MVKPANFRECIEHDLNVIKGANIIHTTVFHLDTDKKSEQ